MIEQEYHCTRHGYLGKINSCNKCKTLINKKIKKENNSETQRNRNEM